MKQNADNQARNLDTTEIHKKLAESAEQMFRLRFQMSMGQPEGLKKVRQLRKERARMLTVLRERELHPENAEPIKRAKKKSAGKTVVETPAKKAPVKAAAKPKPAAKPTAKPAADGAKKASPKAGQKTEKSEKKVGKSGKG